MVASIVIPFRVPIMFYILLLCLMLSHFSSIASPTTTFPGPLTPTKAPSKRTFAPSMAPHRGNSTQAPTPTSKIITKTPTTAPTKAAPVTSAPSVAPSPAPASSVPTSVPTAIAITPSKSPVKPPPHDNDGKKNDSKHGSFSIWRMLGKILAFLILILLSILALGAIMNHRYRIFYFLRGLWYTILGLDCTQWMLAKLGLRHRADTSEMNTVIFDDNEMSYGLLMQENE